MSVDSGARLLDVFAVARLAGFSTAMVWKLLREDRFPQPVKIGKLTRWHRAAVESWIDDL